MTRLMATPAINKGTFSAKTTGTPDSVDVSLSLFGQVIVYDQVNLLHVDAPGKQVSRDQNSGASSPELLHNQFTLILVHAPVLSIINREFNLPGQRPRNSHSGTFPPDRQPITCDWKK